MLPQGVVKMPQGSSNPLLSPVAPTECNFRVRISPRTTRLSPIKASQVAALPGPECHLSHCEPQPVTLGLGVSGTRPTGRTGPRRTLRGTWRATVIPHQPKAALPLRSSPLVPPRSTLCATSPPPARNLLRQFSISRWWPGTKQSAQTVHCATYVTIDRLVNALGPTVTACCLKSCCENVGRNPVHPNA